jgi:hypothetical protein
MSKDVKKMVGEIRGALDKYPREQLQEILAYVFKEYVVEGSLASATGALAMLDARTELEGLSFAELVTWLQLHLDLPELALFDVANGRVHVRAGGRSISLEVARTPEAVAPYAQPAPMPVTPTPAVVTAPMPAATPPSPRPMPPEPRANPTPASSPQPMPPPIAPPQSHQAPPAAPPNQAPAPSGTTTATGGDKKDEASPANRFSWLEVD